MSKGKVLLKDEVLQMKGNDKENTRCFECGGGNPQWASVTLGVYMCLNCGGPHRSLGVHISYVRSTNMDSWSPLFIARMKVGGNSKAKAYFRGCHLVGLPIQDRYNTPEAAAYIKHIQAQAEEYLKDPNTPLVTLPVVPRKQVTEPGDVEEEGDVVVVEDNTDTLLQPEPIEISVKSSKFTEREVKKGDEHCVLITATPPVGHKRTPSDICCVIDISGSMGEEARTKNADGDIERHGLSLLDIVKHAVRTISHTLQKYDRLALVVYSTTARIAMRLTHMTDVGKIKVEQILDKTHVEKRTNIWLGLEKGLELLRTGAAPRRNKCVLLLTDGQPSEHTSAEMIANFKQYRDQHELPCVVSTFGFGYANLDSQLLATVAEEGNGMFSFIPDCGFVGTTFVNAVSNVLSTLGSNVSISLEPKDGASIVGVMGDHKSTKTSWGTMVNLPSLQYGQNLDVVVKMKIPPALPEDQPFMDVTLKFNHWKFGPQTYTVSASERDGNSPEVHVQRRRLKLVECIHRIVLLHDVADENEDFIEKLITDLRSGTDPREVGMLADVTGQIREAVLPQYFLRWGIHYLPSLARAHQLQQSNNFKDPGIQFYGGELFNKLRDEADEIFCKLPPTVSSISSSDHNAAPAFSMAAYNTPHGGCFAGTSLVLMASGMQKRVEDVRKGDKVATLNNQQAEVLCVTKFNSNSNNQTVELVELDSGLLVTPYHPVKIADKWCFPCDIKQPTQRYCPAVYNFVLKENSTHHVMIINGVVCVTLAHNYEGDVVQHPYFGTHKIVDDLKQAVGWQCGFVELNSDCFVRDPQTKLVCSLNTRVDLHMSM